MQVYLRQTLINSMPPNSSLPDSLQYDVLALTGMKSSSTCELPFYCCACDGVKCNACIKVIQWKTAWSSVLSGKQLCPCPAHNAAHMTIGTSTLVDKLTATWPGQLYQFERRVQRKSGKRRQLDLCLPFTVPERAFEVHGPEHDKHSHAKHNGPETSDRLRLQNGLDQGLVCAVLFTSQPNAWDSVLHQVMAPDYGNQNLHSTSSAMLNWLPHMRLAAA